MICKNCNKEIPNDSEYCAFCESAIENIVAMSKTTPDAAALKKGYTYLELKQWKKANEIFEAAIVNDECKAEAYVGKMLAHYKVDSIDFLVAKGKKIKSNNDFNLALKYADSEYANYLKECAIKADKKNKKRAVVLSSVCACVAVVAVLSYFVFIPFGRNFYYKNLITDGKAQKAAKAYQSSKWFEYDKIAQKLFYENGLKLVEAKDYKNAEACFKITKGYEAEIGDFVYKSGVKLVELKDYKNAEACFEIINDYKGNSNYQNYAKAQNLLANGDLESYDYFTELGDFLDSKEILNTNKYFVMVNKLQGEWYSPGQTEAQYRRKMLETGNYYEANGRFYKKEDFESYQQFLECVNEAKYGIIDGVTCYVAILYPSDTIYIAGGENLKINQEGNINLKEHVIGNKTVREDLVIEIIDNTHIKIDNLRVYEKQS